MNNLKTLRIFLGNRGFYRLLAAYAYRAGGMHAKLQRSHVDDNSDDDDDKYI